MQITLSKQITNKSIKYEYGMKIKIKFIYIGIKCRCAICATRFTVFENSNNNYMAEIGYFYV